MRISPVSFRPEIAVVSKTMKVTRSLETSEPDEPVEEEREPDIKDRRNKRRPPRFAVATSAASRSSAGVLSALIDLQITK